MKIIEKNIIGLSKAAKIIKLKIEAAEIARKAEAGQFVVAMVSDKGERFPLTVVDKNKDSITLIVQEAGLTTKFLGKLSIGDSLFALVGPLGHPTEIKKYGKVAMVGGGVGIAEIYPVAKALKRFGNNITTIIGVKTKDLLILEKELREVSDQLYLASDDGSVGKKGFTLDILRDLLKDNKYDLVYAVGPVLMMKSISNLTSPLGIKTLVSLNSLMVDATGMCGSCRVNIDGKVKFACIDGPEFNAHLVDWRELEQRNKTYEKQEKHICNFYKIDG